MAEDSILLGYDAVPIADVSRYCNGPMFKGGISNYNVLE
jgi:hypothetical protein